ncbi:Hypothetical Protein FCC1311_041952 [Hondaea fermentalgiana]|uniref:FAD dependent oxidoreductase domain-containing protein n=1 Tax=Hondaea fermentalgiana TaxID=2315210 RepID=A0A2R5GAD7_9STRA|nr:Hypothetical Protein FCC1311_041952 [Hondaea fermentalgiana]|eukprot:GBG27972.1 Hypothetical Protein FCC1311_041952 [Hondaea fermentalgiana]
MATPPRPFWHTLLPDGKPVAVNDLADDESCRRVGVLVIGCGLTGASAAYHLSQKLGSEVLVVDARDLADGATGRNGGHQWAEVAESGDEVGARHARIEAADITAVEAFVNTLNETERSPLELHRTGGVHFSMDEKEAPSYQSAVQGSSRERHEEYLIQRAGDDKMIIFGGCRHVATDEGEPFSHEGEPEEQVTEALVKGLERIFPDACFRVCHAWTGLMCFTQDGRPLVGPLQESAGQFVALGFGGHGMVRTFTCGRAISSLVLQAREGTKKSSISPEDTEILDFFAVDRVSGAPTCSSSTND